MFCTTHASALNLPEPIPAPLSWRFDVVSALIGAVVALLVARLIYRFRYAIHQSWEERVTEPLANLVSGFQASAGDRYCELVSAWAQSQTLMPRLFPLDTVFVEPRLRSPAPPPQSVSELESQVLPASSQILPLRRTLGGHPLLVIAGEQGSGVTSLLAYVASTCARAVAQNVELRSTLGLPENHLPLCVRLSSMDWGEDEPEDPLISIDTPNLEDQLLDTEPADDELEDDELADDELENDDRDEGGDEEETQDEDREKVISTEEDKDRSRRSGRREISPTDRLIGTAISTVEGNRAMTSVLRQYLQAGQAIVLVDGWDTLLSEHRELAAQWLSETVEALPGNIWLIGSGLRGYAPLTEMGFVPLKLVPWSVVQVEHFAKRCLSAYVVAATDITESPALLRQLTTALLPAARAEAPPFELTLRAFVQLLDGQAPTQRAALFDRTLELLLQQKEDKKEKADWQLAASRATLEQTAAALQQAGRTTASREQLDPVIESVLPSSEELPARAATHVFQALTGDWGLLRRVTSNRYAFVHPLWQAYLAARQLIASDSADLAERLDDPRWDEVLRFYVELGDAKPLLTAWAHRPADIFQTHLTMLSSWISVAPPDATWREGAMGVLGRSFLQSKYPAPIRQRLADALASTSMPGVTYLFKQALQHPDAGMRKAAVQGLTKVAEESDLRALELVLTDQDPAVPEAMVQGLAQLGTDASTRWLARLLVEGDETLGIVAAEALAQCGEDGVNFLHEAIESDDMIVRRGAVYGLARLEARDALERVAREDKQWIVRSAASGALEELDKQEETFGISPPPQIDQLPWLISWAATRGDGVGLGEAARPMLQRALHEGDVLTRWFAARALAQVGRLDDVKPLRAALASPDPDVVNAVLEALAEISDRYDLTIR